MVSRAKFSFRLPSRRLADSIAKALEPELGSQAGAKAHARLRVDGKILELKFYARDTTALRAILNSYLRMISACIRVTKTIDELKT